MTTVFFRSGRAVVAFPGGVLLAGCVTFAPAVAHGYTIASVATDGCHESITSAALRAVREDLPTAAPLPADRNERALIRDLEFAPDADMNDLGGATLLVGVRDNDLKGRDSSDVTQLALVHGNPSAQREHCLRNTQEKEPGGSEMAVRDCRAFIRERIGQALEGLDATGTPDLGNRTSLPLYLSVRHRVDALLPTYYLRIGQAIHALEDSFTHTYRTPDGMQITTVLDYVDEANGSLNEASDGPPHAGELDSCSDADELRTRRHALAIEAASAILRATLDPNQTPDQKMAAVDATLDKYLSYSPGCTFANGWCNAPEHAYGNGSTFGCNVSGPERASGLGWTGLLGLLGLVGRRRWRRRGSLLGVAALVGSTFLPSNALAKTKHQQPKADSWREHAPPPPVVAPVAEPGPKDPSKTTWGAYLGASGAVNHAAAAATLGARLRLSRHWGFGLDAEWNPWIAVNGTTSLRSGAFNGYGTVILRMPLAYEKFNLRSTLNFGMSRLLMDLYGAPKGTTGIYAGISPLGLEWKMSRSFYLIVNPLNFALPVPQLKGVPFSYWQYRVTVGLEIYAG